MHIKPSLLSGRVENPVLGRFALGETGPELSKLRNSPRYGKFWPAKWILRFIKRDACPGSPDPPARKYVIRSDNKREQASDVIANEMATRRLCASWIIVRGAKLLKILEFEDFSFFLNILLVYVAEYKVSLYKKRIKRGWERIYLFIGSCKIVQFSV